MTDTLIQGSTVIQDVLPEKFRTSDLYFAAYLMTAGCILLDTSSLKEEGNFTRIMFCFEKSPLLKDLKFQYFNRKAKVEALNFVDSIRSLKAVIHQSPTF
jgi:hypothetical protein